MAQRLAALFLALALAGCSTAAAPPATSVRPLSVQAERGRALAALRCAACHAIGPGEERSGAAPSFSRIRMRFNPLAWDRVMTEVASGEHGEMPPVTLDPSEVQDLRAYLDSLR